MSSQSSNIGASVLIVDDDTNLLEIMKMRLEASGFDVTTAKDEEEARRFINERAFDLAIVDLQLVQTDGISLMTEIHSLYPLMPVIILTAHGSIESAVEAMRKGAFNYLTKPFDARELVVQIERALRSSALEKEVQRLRDFLREEYEFKNIIGRSAPMKQVLEQVSRIAQVDSSVYIEGESGTGKELIARAIHLASPRRQGPFVAINCASLPEGVLESELFGHERGAFTGAVRSMKGIFQRAEGGTVFLDEIGDMPLSIQGRFLRVLQERQFYPLGSDRPVNVDVRVIVATNKDLAEEVRAGNFREDLFFRIHVIPIKLPPLRDRKEDIPLLVSHFIKKYSSKMNKDVRGIKPKALKKLMLYDWPGNVRELENTIEYAVAMARGKMIDEELITVTPASAVSSLRPYDEAKESFERQYLVNLLKHTKGNVSKAAEIAGRYRADLYNLMKKHGINPKDYK
ncbi:MAG: sigma-54-dependent Fis family transcriptional regulator [Nitrospirae bacterium]|nr:MAG: sigma-54-dependent Fis family transcriptional regulator [Nitrospirota bacterium]